MLLYDLTPSILETNILTRYNCSIAGNAALLTLDSMSLLLSKQNPTQAGLTLSQQLRDMVGIGTLGADKLNDSNVTPAKTKDKEAVAMGWTLLEINKTRDSAEEAASFLEKEINSESKYWEDIVGVKKAGWSISRVPQERHTLGVRFGFSEGTFRLELCVQGGDANLLSQLPPSLKITVWRQCGVATMALQISTLVV